MDVATGAVREVVGAAGWGGSGASLLTTIAWDAEGLFDGNLYVGDQGADGDGDSRIFRVAPDGAARGGIFRGRKP